MPDNDLVLMLEQRRLPDEETYVELRTVDEVAAGIRDMVVRGAPAIGISAAYGMVLAARAPGSSYREGMQRAAALLKATRPTAVNLAWAVERCLELAVRHEALPGRARVEELAELARRIHREDVAGNRILGALGAERIPDGATILTHCNAGALATGGYGTALGVVRAAREAGKTVRVLADETRPYLQGSRLTAWELAQDGIDVRIVTDGMSGYLFNRGEIDLAVVGADRIARSGDVANKIGTYTVAVLAGQHGRPFYVAAPFSTFDLACPSGSEIPIEQRDESEVTEFRGKRVAPTGVRAVNPAFDVTPARAVTAIFTERGVVDPVTPEQVRALADRKALSGGP
jgi:methylthioribose-1-phosphate isomerase